MTHRHPRAQWVLPINIDPSTSTCYMVPVPDDPFHKAAFLGALATLGSGMSWQDDDAHSAKDVAAVWRTIADNLEPCEMVNIRLKPTDFCVIQLSLDGGVTWSDVADLSSCAHAAAIDEIGQAIDRGDLSGGGQQPGQGSGVSGQCYDYDLTIQGNNRWNSPVSVEAGDLITITKASGAWSSVTPLGAWHCADGENYVLGQCAAGGVTETTDPAPSVLHMRLIGNLPGDTTTPYFDMYNTAYVVPVGVVLGDFFLQANDSALADNQGSVTLHVQICKNPDVVALTYGFGSNGPPAVAAGNTVHLTGVFRHVTTPSSFDVYTVDVALDGQHTFKDLVLSLSGWTVPPTPSGFNVEVYQRPPYAAADFVFTNTLVLSMCASYVSINSSTPFTIDMAVSLLDCP